LRLKRIKPHGEDSRRNERSADVILVPASPVMNARSATGAA
jgi:hypothetical protein